MACLAEPDRAYLRALCDASFYHFVRVCGGHVNQGGDLSPSLHGPLCRFATDRSIKRKAIFMPRAQRKSTTFTKWRAIWEYLQNNEIRILIVSESLDIGKGLLEFIERQILNNSLLRWLYPELAQVNDSWARKHRFSSTMCDLPHQGIYSEPTISVLGVGAAAQSRHVDLILADDLVGKKAMESPLVLEGVLNWFQNTPELLVNPDPNSPSGSEISMVGTFWAPGDLGTYIKEKCPEYQVRITPALHYSKAQDTERVKWVQNPTAFDNETNYPENPAFSTDYYKAMMNDPEKELVFWTQHMNMPERPTMLTKFEASWFRSARLEEMEDEIGNVRRYFVPERVEGLGGGIGGAKVERFGVDSTPLYMVIDPGGFAETKLIKRGSRNAIVVGGQPNDSVKKFVVDCYAGRLKEPSAFIGKVFEMWEKWKPRHCFIEVYGQQGYILKDLIERAKTACAGFKVSQCPPTTSANAKDDRICALLPRFENGEVYFLTGMAYGSDLRQEIRAYPNSLTVDLVDALGWLNQLCWSRVVPGDMGRANAERLRRLQQARVGGV